jgi:hypothetical protein
MYGRFFTHWDKFGSANNQRLKPWLDPGNTGATSAKSLKLSETTSGISSNNPLEKLNCILNSNQIINCWQEWI